MQRPCSGRSPTEFGVSLQSASGLAVGVSNNEYFGSRLLVLQKPSGAKYQSSIPQRT